MNYIKTYTIPVDCFALVQCGCAIGPRKVAIRDIMGQFATEAGKGWQLVSVSPSSVSGHDLGSDLCACYECELYAAE